MITAHASVHVHVQVCQAYIDTPLLALHCYHYLAIYKNKCIVYIDNSCLQLIELFLCSCLDQLASYQSHDRAFNQCSLFQPYIVSESVKTSGL